MTIRPSQIHQIPETVLALRLPSLGRMLDDMEQGTIPMSARQYRKVALEASALIDANIRHPDVRTACVKSHALAELMQNALIQEAALKNKMNWQHSMKF